MIDVLILLGIAAAIILAGYYSGMETAAYGASLMRLKRQAAEGDTLAAQALLTLQNIARLVTTTLIGHNLAVYLGTFELTSWLESRHVPESELWATLYLTPFCFIFAETLPKRLAHARPTAYARGTARIILVSRICFWPLAMLLGGIAAVLHHFLDRLGFVTLHATGREQLLEHLEAGANAGLLSEEQHQMAERILVIEELTLSQVMLPVSGAFVVREDETCRDAARRIAEAGRNRAPLTDRQGNMTGTLITLNAILRSPASLDQPVSHLAEEALTLDGNTPAAKAFRRLQGENARLAIVTNKRGKPLGIVTVSYLLSRIVGAMRL